MRWCRINKIMTCKKTTTNAHIWRFLNMYQLAWYLHDTQQVLYAASPEDWTWLELLPHELSVAVSSEFLVSRGLPLSGRVNFDSLNDW